jgi:hypothetical protein
MSKLLTFTADEATQVTPEGIFTGYAALFGVPDLAGDMIEPGAFVEAIEKHGDQIKMLFAHNSAEPIGRWLDMHEDDKGLFVRGELLLEVERAREVHALMEKGATEGLSIAGNILEARKIGPEPDPDKFEMQKVSVTKFDLWEVSVVSFPAQPEARVDSAMTIMNDNVILDGPRRTRDGYLAASVKVARTGIQMYKGYEVGHPEMDDVRVYRPEDQVFSKDALASFAHRPVTIEHPSEMVTSDNWKKYAVGQTGDEIQRDGDFIRVPMVLMDAAAIDAVEGGKKELSMGYLCDLTFASGKTMKGEAYDAIQTDIRGNHLAVVGAARGGPELRIGDALRNKVISAQLGFAATNDTTEYQSALRAIRTQASQDGADAVVTVCDTLVEKLDDILNPETKEDNMSDLKMTKVEVDGIEIDVADASAAFLRKGLAALAKKASDLEAKLAESEEDKKKNDAAIVAKDANIDELKVQLADAELTPAKLDEAVKDRAALVEKATALIGDKFVADGKTVSEIRREAVTVKLGDKSTDWTDEQFATGFDTLSAVASTTDADGKPKDPLANAIRDNVPATDAREEAYAGRIDELNNAWKA